MSTISNPITELESEVPRTASPRILPDHVLSELITLKVPASATTLAAYLRCTTDEVLAAIHKEWWQIEQQAGEGGWMYSQRKVMSKRARLQEVVSKYNDSGITKSFNQRVKEVKP
jgi:hypothetical protein